MNNYCIKNEHYKNAVKCKSLFFSASENWYAFDKERADNYTNLKTRIARIILNTFYQFV